VQIPYAAEQGNKSNEQGDKIDDQGIKSAEHGKARQGSAGLLPPATVIDAWWQHRTLARQSRSG
jgi:hypothetical protein